MTENTPTATVTLSERTARIKYRLERGNSIMNKAKLAATYEFIEAGKDLIEVKKELPHGQWQKWLADNFNLKTSTAKNLMAIAELSKRQPVGVFNYTQLVQLLPLSPTELPDFLQAMTANGTPAESLSKRALREAVQSWRKSKSLPTPPVTIDATPTSDDTPAVTLTFDASDTITPATIFSVEPPTPTTPVTFTPAPTLPTKVEQLSLFDLPALPAKITQPQYQLPTLVTEAAAKIDTPVYVVPRPTKAEFPAPSILLVLATLSASWTQRLIAKATAFIMTKIPVQRSDGRTARKSVLIVYNGDNSDAFSNAFRYFGLTFFTNQKSSAASNSEALW